MTLAFLQRPGLNKIRHISTYFLRTYGCQMNELDGEIMRGILEQRGLVRTEDEEQADLLLFNTCSIRDLAERKVLGKLGKLGRGDTRNKIIGITGCMANHKKGSLFDKVPHLDFVLGTNNIHQLNQVLDQVLETGSRQLRTDDLFHEEIDYLLAKRDDKVKAYVSIIRGCDKHCTYCCVPYTRGKEVSRPPESIVAECEALAQQGYREIILLGQNVNSYGKDAPQWNCLFHDLLYRLDKIPGIERIRFMTSHPIDISLQLMEAIRDLPKMCEFVHFPLQAGSDRILRKMHRIYTVEQYLEKVALLRQLVPDVALGTDIIVGFPTETEEEFEETYRLMEQIQFSVAFIFAFSPRKNTPARRWRDDVPEPVKQERLQRLLQLHQQILQRQLHDQLHTEVEVLVESVSFRDGELLKGRTRRWQQVLFPGDPSLVGTLQKVQVHSYSHQTLLGEKMIRPLLQVV
jgi:tRNA-2-methylthio-N6-dimethylallyladenosine synthase